MRQAIAVVLLCAASFGLGCLFMASRQVGLAPVFNTQPVFSMMTPHLRPMLEYKDEETVVLHRPPSAWFTVSCVDWSSTHLHPNYSNPDCWPSLEEKRLTKENWPGYGKVQCEFVAGNKEAPWRTQ